MAMGRPTKLTPDVREKIVNSVKLGQSYERAALMAGVSESSIYKWKVRANDGESGHEYAEFLQALKKAEIEGEALRLAQINTAAKDGTWQAAAWWLERRFPQQWGRFDKLALTNPAGDKEYQGNQDVLRDLKGLDQKALRKLRGILERDESEG